MTTPQELLKEVKEHFKYIPNVKTESSEVFLKNTLDTLEDTIENLNYPEEEKVKLFMDDHIVEDLSKDILEIFEEDERERIKTKIAFGKIINTTVNALCVEKDGNFVIVVNEGLLQLLHRFGKLLTASAEPHNVLYCNRGNVKDIDSQTYKTWAFELIENYEKYNSPIGAMVNLTKDAMISHAITLNLQELFVVCHELGHYLNGDLFQKENLKELINTSWNIYCENKNHEIEYKADLTGFNILCKVAKKKYGIGKDELLPFIAFLFDILGTITKETDSHPDPIIRTYNIIKYNFSEQSAEDYLKTYSDELSLNDFFATK